MNSTLKNNVTLLVFQIFVKIGILKIKKTIKNGLPKMTVRFCKISLK